MAENPNVLSKEEVSEILESVIEKENLKGAEIIIGSERGDGYLSCMTKVALKKDGRALHLILKCAPKSQELRKSIGVEKFYGREILFYDVIIPAFRKFQEEKKVKEPFNSVAKCFKVDRSICNEKIILENLKDGEGFKLFNKKEQMDDVHVSFVIREYAKFHAVSFAIQDQNPELYHQITDNNNLLCLLYTCPDEFFDCISNFIGEIIDYYPENSELQEALKKVKDGVREFFIFMSKSKPKYNVINHADCWTNNMLFKYEEGTTTVKELKLVDFQTIRTFSPVTDLCYFLYGCSGKEIYDHHEKYMKIYHDTLTEQLNQMGSDSLKLYPFEVFKEDWKKYAKLGYMMRLALLKVIYVDPEEMVDLQEMADSGAGFSNMFKGNPKYEHLIKESAMDLTIHMFKNGFI